MPEGWSWARLNQIFNFIDYRGSTPTKISSGVPLITAKNVKSGYIDYTFDDYISEDEYADRQQRGISCYGDILFTTEAPLGNAAIADLDKFSAGQRLITFQHYGNQKLNNTNFLYFLLSDFFQNQLNANKTGSTVAGIKAAILKGLFLPVPPIEEQQRIAASCKNMFNMIEIVKNEQEDISKLISITKSKILDLAIRGKLVPQDPNDEPASVLLDRIQSEKEELIKAGKIKRDKKESVIFKGEDNSYYEKIGNEVHCIDEDIPFKIPHNWIWCRMSSISDIIMGTSPKGTSICENPQYTEFHQGKIYFSDMLIKNSGQYTRELTKIAKPNSILLCVRAPVGEVNLTDRKICIGRGLASISPLGAVSRYFMLYWIKAFRETLIKKATGTTFVAVTTDVVKGLLLPIPPLAEQYRITNKIQSLVENLIYIEKSLR